MAAVDCMWWADRWLEKYAPHENAMAIAEDADRIKPLLKHVMRMLRSPNLELNLNNNDAASFKEIDFPLKRIIDTVHFAAKPESAPLQLADWCAFMIGRHARGKQIPQHAMKIIGANAHWASDIAKERGVRRKELF